MVQFQLAGSLSFKIKLVSNIVRTFTKESQFLSENVYYICFSFPQSYYLRTAFEQIKRKTWEY